MVPQCDWRPAVCVTGEGGGISPRGAGVKLSQEVDENISANTM